MRCALASLALVLSSACASARVPGSDNVKTLTFPFVDAAHARDSGPSLACADAAGDAAGCVPVGDVVGELPAVTEGEPGYLELTTLTFMSAREARLPSRPYLEGKMTADGFMPTTRQVQR